MSFKSVQALKMEKKEKKSEWLFEQARSVDLSVD